MKIATFNINNVNRRLPNLLDWLKSAKPDIVCLQELKCTDQRFQSMPSDRPDYHAVWRGQRTWNGVAILSRSEPVVTRTTLPGDPKDEQARYIEAAINGILVGCIHELAAHGLTTEASLSSLTVLSPSEPEQANKHVELASVGRPGGPPSQSWEDYPGKSPFAATAGRGRWAGPNFARTDRGSRQGQGSPTTLASGVPKHSGWTADLPRRAVPAIAEVGFPIKKAERRTRAGFTASPRSMFC